MKVELQPVQVLASPVGLYRTPAFCYPVGLRIPYLHVYAYIHMHVRVCRDIYI